MNLKEWGGSLPLETYPSLPARFDGFGVEALNSGRSAIYAAAAQMEAKRVWLPAWLCPTVKDYLVRRELEVCEYHVGGDFLPRIQGVEAWDAVVWTNWLGCMSSATKRTVVDLFCDRLIIDNCHAYFEPPVKGVYNVYSCRKFLGVPHGAFLVGATMSDSHLPSEEEGVSGIDRLDRARRRGSGSVYSEYLDDEAGFAGTYKKMNPFLRTFVSLLDEDEIVRVRRRNFDSLRDVFEDRFAPGMCRDSVSPVWYPLYVTDEGLRDRLVSKKVFVPKLWKRVLADPDATETEVDMTRFLVPLPIDQRYSVSDMKVMAETVLSAMKGA